MTSQAPWDPPTTRATSVDEAAKRFIAAAEALKEHMIEISRAETRTDHMFRMANEMALMALDNGYQFVTGEQLPAYLQLSVPGGRFEEEN